LSSDYNCGADNSGTRKGVRQQEKESYCLFVFREMQRRESMEISVCLPAREQVSWSMCKWRDRKTSYLQ